MDDSELKACGLEEVQRLTEQEEAAGKELADPTLPIFRWAALHDLDDLHRAYCLGEPFALMLAIRKCANHGLTMPDWVVSGYIKGFDLILNVKTGRSHGKAKSWDDAFGRPVPKGQHLASLRQRHELWPRILNRFRELRNQNPPPPIDDELFEKIAKELGVGKTLVKDIYYKVPKFLKEEIP